MIDFILQPLGEEFMRRALLEVLLIGIVGGALGCWIVFYGVSYAAESLSHALFPGLVLAALAGAPLLLGAAPAIAIAAVAIALIGRVPMIGRDTGVAIVVTGLFGLGALLALSSETPPGVQNLLFGDILAPSDSDLILAAALGAAIISALGVMHWRLLVVAFDRANAGAAGVSPTAVDVGVLIGVAAAVLVAVQGLGSLLAVVALVGPAATARVLAGRIGSMMLVASAIGVGAGVVGLYLSYYAGLAAGASIAGCVVVAYLVVVAVAGARTPLRPMPVGRVRSGETG